MLGRKENLKIGLFRPITLWPFPSKILAIFPNQKDFGGGDERRPDDRGCKTGHRRKSPGLLSHGRPAGGIPTKKRVDVIKKIMESPINFNNCNKLEFLTLEIYGKESFRTNKRIDRNPHAILSGMRARGNSSFDG